MTRGEDFSDQRNKRSNFVENWSKGGGGSGTYACPNHVNETLEVFLNEKVQTIFHNRFRNSVFAPYFDAKSVQYHKKCMKMVTFGAERPKFF